MGVEMIEFHITFDKEMEGSDQSSSFDESDFMKIVTDIGVVVDGFGDGEICISENEQLALKKLRRF